MAANDKYILINIRRYIDNPELGEEALLPILSEFSCSINPDVEQFLKKNAIEFTKKNQSVTYLVFSVKDGELLGYFSLAIKPLTVRGEAISNTIKKKLLRVSELDEQSDTYTMSAYLIAQLGKNYAINEGKSISGDELLELAWDKIKGTQYALGGMVAFLEAEKKDDLICFYQNNRFCSEEYRLVRLQFMENQGNRVFTFLIVCVKIYKVVDGRWESAAATKMRL